MILGCPECQTRFAIDAQALRPDGRRVKCGKCGHVWFEEPPPPSAAEPLSVTPLEPEEQSPVPTPNLPAVTVADQRRTAGAAWVLVVLLLAVVAAQAWYGRASIARAWPPAEAIYGVFGIAAFPPPGAGFSVDMEVKRDANRLQIAGEVSNTTDQTRALPPIYGLLKSDKGENLFHWQVEVETQSLGPGESVPFSKEFDPMPDGTANVSVLFTNPADN